MIHKFKVGSKRLVLDVPSGVLHEIDDCAWEVIALLEEGKGEDEIHKSLQLKYDVTEIIEVISELSHLQQRELLFSKDRLQDYTPSLENAVVKALCLHIAHDCNMSCRYCFASNGHFGGERQLMGIEVGQRAIDFLINQSQGRHNLEIDFFGGEPLLGFEVIKQLVVYGQEQGQTYDKTIRYTLTTNGVLLTDEIISFLNAHNIAVVLSLDGRPEINDRVRQLSDGAPSYVRVTPNLIALANSRQHQNYYVRGTFTADNLDFTQDISHMLALGFKHISMEPVVGSGQSYSISEEDLPAICVEYEHLFELYRKHREQGEPFTFFHFDLDLEQGPCLAKRLTGCGAGFDYLAVAPNGDLYPCHQFVGQDEFVVGNVGEPLKLNRSLQKQFVEAHLFNKPHCLNCWAKYYCSGGCHANAFFARGDILEQEPISCRMQKKRIECALALKAH